MAAVEPRRVLVTGAGGQLGRYLVASLVRSGHQPRGIGAHAGPGIDRVVDIGDPVAVQEVVSVFKPQVVIHAAAYTDVDGCERDPERAMLVNADGSANVAQAAHSVGAWLVAVSTDFVFPGDGGAPYSEDAVPNPVSMYGRSKLAGEEAVLATDERFAVARTAWVYGGAGKHFPRTVLTVLRDRGEMEVVDDEVGSPTFAADLAEALVALAAQAPDGRFHLTNDGSVSRYAFAAAVADAAGTDPARVRPTTTEAFLARYPLPAKRPPNSTLANHRAAALGVRLRPWQDAVAEYAPTLVKELEAS
jgi:dTDP-4-dehydrorhamnose reductase